MSGRGIVGNVFRVNPENIKVLDSPSSFKEELFSMVKSAKKRICISSLYFDNMNEFNDILKNMLEDGLSGYNDVKMKFVLDLNRTMRDRPQFEKLAENVLRYPKSFSISLLKIPGTFDIYNSNTLCGFANKWLGKYFNFQLLNEVIGVYHIKLYIADDNIIISGANLSHEYLTDRQDRYILLKNERHLCDYFEKFIDLIGSYSHRVLPSKEISQPSKTDIYQLKKELSILSNSSDLLDKLDFEIKSKSNDYVNYRNCVLLLFFQLSKIKIESDKSILEKLLSSSNSEGTDITIASPYLNLPDYTIQFLNDVNSLDIITGVPISHKKGVFQGIRSLLLPLIYDDINHIFIRRLSMKKNRPIVNYSEYNRQNWSFHFKGIYIHKKIRKCIGNERSNNALIATTLGSSNYNERSTNRDFECTFVLIPPANHPLEDYLNNELNNIKKHTTKQVAPIITLRRFLCTKFIKYLRKYL